MTPTARALAECRKRGWEACVVEKWIPQTRRRKDAFGFGDLLAVDPNRPGPLLLQVTTTANMAARVTKIREECGVELDAWLAAGGRVEVWGFAKQGKAGARKLWTLRVVEVTASTGG